MRLVLTGGWRQIYLSHIEITYARNSLAFSPPPPPGNFTPMGIEEATAEVVATAVAVSAIVIGLSIAMGVGLLWFCRKRLRKALGVIGQFGKASPMELAELQTLMLAAEEDQGSQQHQQLSLLKEAAHRVAVSQGQSSLQEVVSDMLALRATISPELTDALQDEFARRNPGRGTVGASDREMIELLKLLLEPPVDTPEERELASGEVAPGFAGGGGAKLRPPQLYPVRTSVLPEEVVTAAYSEFEKKHGFPASSEQEAVLALRSAIAPHAKKLQLVQLTVPRPRQLGAQMPEQVYRAAASFTSGQSSNPFQNREQMNLLKQSLAGATAADPAAAKAALTALPPTVLLEARSLFEAQMHFPPSSDAEALKHMKTFIDQAGNAPSYLTKAAEREEQLGRQGLNKLPPVQGVSAPPLPDELVKAAESVAGDEGGETEAEALANAVFDTSVPQEGWDGGGGVRTGPPKLHAPQEELLKLQDMIDRSLEDTSSAVNADIPDPPLDYSKPQLGWDGGGGVRIPPPKLTNPEKLQPPDLATPLQIALRKDYANKAGVAEARGMEVEDLARRIVTGFDEQQQLQKEHAHGGVLHVEEEPKEKKGFFGWGKAKKAAPSTSTKSNLPHEFTGKNEGLLMAIKALEAEPLLFGGLLDPREAIHNRIQTGEEERSASPKRRFSLVPGKANKIAPDDAGRRYER